MISSTGADRQYGYMSSHIKISKNTHMLHTLKNTLVIESTSLSLSLLVIRIHSKDLDPLSIVEVPLPIRERTFEESVDLRMYVSPNS